MPLNVQPDAVKREASRLFREDGIVVEPTHHKENIEKEDSCLSSEGKSVWNTLSCPCRTLLGAAGQGAAPKRDAHVLRPRTRERKRVRKGRHQRDRVKGVERKEARSSDRLGHVCPHRREQRGRRRGRVQTGRGPRDASASRGLRAARGAGGAAGPRSGEPPEALPMPGFGLPASGL